MDSIRDIISQVIGNLATKKPYSKRNIHEVWKIIAGDQANHSAVKDFNNGFLKIHVDSSARLFQLNLRKDDLIDDLKKEIPHLKDIIFKVGQTK